jgi:hypothetical protein
MYKNNDKRELAGEAVETDKQDERVADCSIQETCTSFGGLTEKGSWRKAALDARPLLPKG